MATFPDETTADDVQPEMDLEQLLLASLGNSESDSDPELLAIQQKMFDIYDPFSSADTLPYSHFIPRSQFDPCVHDQLFINTTLPFIGSCPLQIATPSDSDPSTSENSRCSNSSGRDIATLPPERPPLLQPLASRKRSRNTADLDPWIDPFPEAKSWKATPTPGTTSPPIPNPADSFFISDDSSELHQLLGLPNSSNIREIQHEQMSAERWLQERTEQEGRDEEFARSLQDGWYASSYSSPAPSCSNFGSLVPPLGPVAGGLTCQAPLPTYSIPFRRAHSSSALQSQYSSQTLCQQSSAPRTENYIDLTTDDFLGEICLDRFPAYCQSSSSRTTAWDGNSGTNSAMETIWSGADAVDTVSSEFSDSLLSSGLRETDGGIASTLAFSALGETHQYAAPFGIPGDNIAIRGHSLLHLSHQLSARQSINIGNNATELISSTKTQVGCKAPPPSDAVRDQYLSVYDSLKPETTHRELKLLLENIRPDQDLDRKREGTPNAMKYPLMEHQKLGLAWMKSMEECSNKGGILADDMGLGKTVQALALIVSNPSDNPARKTTLIVAPVALVHQWKREIQRMLKPGEHQLSVFVLHGEKRTTSFNCLKKYDVVLTTFGTLSSELKRKESFHAMKHENPNAYQSLELSGSYLPILGDSCKWYRVIIDEAQCIKNRSTKAAQACYSIDSKYRWCMSGTPMMNNVTELYSLIHFLRIGPYNNIEKFNITFTRPLRSLNNSLQSRAMKQLQALLKAILLRRTKSSKIDGKPILQLPPRSTEKIHAIFSADEQELYKALETRTQLQFNKYLKAGTVGRNYSNVLVLLLRLRQACCHPHLITDFGVEANANISEIDLMANAKLLGADVVARLKENEASECPVCIDAVENAIIFFPCGHSTCAECFARISDPSQGLAQGNDGSFEIRCPNCRAKIDPNRITDNVSFNKVFGSKEGKEAPDDTSPEGSHGDCRGDYDSDSDSDGDNDSDSEEDSGSDDDSMKNFIVDDTEVSGPSGTRKASRKNRKGKGKALERPKKSLAELKKDGMKNARMRKKYLNYLAKTWQTSAKIDKAMEILGEIQARGDGQKTIIFSQFTSLLDLLEIPIMRQDWGYRRYDGSMKPSHRNEAVLEFTDNEDCKIMLVSLKAGNAGLNLVAASQVIIFDPFWNPYIEEQAIDRAHRIGQMRPVVVHRILVENTVEDRILALQDKKRELIEGALDEKASINVGRLGTRELAFLFGVS